MNKFGPCHLIHREITFKSLYVDGEGWKIARFMGLVILALQSPLAMFEHF